MDGRMEVEVSAPEGEDPAEPEGAIEPPVDDVPPESAEPEGRRYPSTLGGACYLLVLAASAAGLGLVAQGHWRDGIKVIAGALFVAAVVRGLLPASQAGMLAVRRRVVDIAILVVIGAVLWFLSTSIPNQPPL
jgi:hypothetical protein